MDGHLRSFGALLAALKTAEEISRDIAGRQAIVAPDAAMRARLLVQARQEAVHASAFAAALDLAAPRALCPPPLARALADYRARLETDLDAGALGASLLGLQVIFEGLGAVALRPPDSALSHLGATLLPMRALMLRQEEAHQATGEACLRRLGLTAVSDALRAPCREYAVLAERAVSAAVELFDAFPLDRQRYSLAAASRIDAIRRQYEGN